MSPTLMAALLEPSLLKPIFPSSSHCNASSFRPPQSLRLQKLNSKPIFLPLLYPSKSCPCSAGTVDPPPASTPTENPDPNANIESITRGTESRKDRRKVVRIAWENLVRWSRSWRSKVKTDVLERTKKVVVLEGGSFGTAMAAHVANNKAEMEVYMLLRDPHVCRSINESHCNYKYFPEHKLPENVFSTTDAKDALMGANFCLHAVPVQFSSSFLEGISQHVDPNLPFISFSKGLELHTLRMMSQIIPHALGNPRLPFVALSGPSFALELMKKLHTAMVVASKDKSLANASQQLLASQYLRMSTSRCTQECPCYSSRYCRRDESWE